MHDRWIQSFTVDGKVLLSSRGVTAVRGGGVEVESRILDEARDRNRCGTWTNAGVDDADASAHRAHAMGEPAVRVFFSVRGVHFFVGIIYRAHLLPVVNARRPAGDGEEAAVADVAAVRVPRVVAVFGVWHRGALALSRFADVADGR